MPSSKEIQPRKGYDEEAVKQTSGFDQMETTSDLTWDNVKLLKCNNF